MQIHREHLKDTRIHLPSDTQGEIQACRLLLGMTLPMPHQESASASKEADAQHEHHQYYLAHLFVPLPANASYPVTIHIPQYLHKIKPF